MARDHHRVTEMATWGDLPLADQESLRFEGEQELRRCAIVWHWRALGAPDPEKWDTQPGPSSVPGTAKTIQLLMGLPDKCRETIRIVLAAEHGEGDGVTRVAAWHTSARELRS